MLTAKEQTKLLFRKALIHALRPVVGFEVTRAFFAEIAEVVKANPQGCILRCQNQQQKEAAERWLKKNLPRKFQFFPVKMKDEE